MREIEFDERCHPSQFIGDIGELVVRQVEGGEVGEEVDLNWDLSQVVATESQRL